MCGGKEELLRKQKEQEVIRAGIHDQLVNAQNWNDVEGGNTIDERRTAFRNRLIQRGEEENAGLLAHLREEREIMKAVGAEESNLQVPVTNTKKSWKEKREDAKHTEEMQQITSAGDYRTYKMQQSIKRVNAECDNSCTEEIFGRAQQANVDTRVLRSFVSGYRTGTLSKEEKRKKEADKAFLEDYISKDLERRRPHLVRITREMLEARITEDMLSEEYMENHTAELVQLCNRMTYFQNILKDPINQQFFSDLPPLERDLLQQKYSDTGGASAALLVNRLAMKGISLPLGELYEDVTSVRQNRVVRELAPQVVFAQQMDGALVEQFHREQQELKRREEEVYRQTLQQELKIARNVLVAEYKSDEAAVAAARDFHFTSRYQDKFAFDELTTYRSMIENAPEVFAAHQDALKKLYQRLYRQYDALGDVTLDIRAAQDVGYQYIKSGGVQVGLTWMADTECEHLEDTREILSRQLDETADAIKFYVKGKPLNERARKALEQLGLTEDAERLRVQRLTPLQIKMENMTFSERSQEKSGQPLSQWFGNNFRKSIAEVTTETERKGLFEKIEKRFSDKAKYGEAYSGSRETGSFANTAREGTSVLTSGLISARMAPQLIGVLGHGETEDSMLQMYDDLLCCGRYQYLKFREGKQNEDGTDLLSEAEKNELAAFTDEKLNELDAAFDRGMLKLKDLQYKQLCRLRDKYGTLGSQLHPEDFIARIGPEFFDETAFLQDLQQMMQGGAKYFDFSKPEDQEYRNLANYYNAMFCIARGYTLADASAKMMDPALGLEMFKAQMSQLKESGESRKLEKFVGGPSLSREEEEEYHGALRQRFGGENAYRLFGHFSPGSGEPVKEEPVQETRETNVEETVEEIEETRVEAVEERAEEITEETLEETIVEIHEEIEEDIQDVEFLPQEERETEETARQERERVRTREEATNTLSDQLSSRHRNDLRGIVQNDLGGLAQVEGRYVPQQDTPLTRALCDYCNGDRYSVGYTEERRRLQVALRELEKARREIGGWSDDEKLQREQYIRGIGSLQALFAEMTNGTLEIPEEHVDTRVEDYTDRCPAEVGTIERGSFRNALIRGLTYWSDQKETPLFSHDPTVNDLKQRTVSNCYMVAATAGLVNVDPALLKRCIRDNQDGTVTVRLYNKVITGSEQIKEANSKELVELVKKSTEKAWSLVKPDDGGDPPTGEKLKQKVLEILDSSMNDFDERTFYQDRELLMTIIQNVLNELEVFDDYEEDSAALEIEKALDAAGKLHKAIPSYEPVYVKVSKEIPRIAAADALSAGALWMQMIEKACAFVGRNGVKGYQSLWYGEGGEFLERLLGVAPEQVSTTDEEQLFEDICRCQEQRMVYNAGTKGSVGAQDGLNAGHAYTVMGGKTVGNKKYVLLRNPYSTMSLKYETNGTKSRTGMHLDTQSDETYGQFYMEFEEFLQKFQNLTRTDLNRVN